MKRSLQDSPSPLKTPEGFIKGGVFFIFLATDYEQLTTDIPVG